MNEAKIEIFDNGGKTTDRYTVIIRGKFGCNVFLMSSDANTPNGVNVYAGDYDMLGDMSKQIKIEFDSLPSGTRKAIVDRVHDNGGE